ncbi:methylated-DNA--[protein]-cysteine S-methyltransferase [Fulvivirgaceae bacterium BMA10]|uniref:Methylated-DNA--protein-cysteine methyltransferase n=1 Tax=Splendidivirga corallicola TaxID=3051826 RepID=A0ABT8KPZ1_9BACT|nr:methylated-DNA--[protein]-cysteine S-methyltransferase [Fulvivirgaceae bacterium BMA10]
MKKKLSFQEKYQIVLNKDVSYEGIFFTAVKTTGVFCRPSCPARKPKIENVVFYDNVQEAIRDGYRPCKTCKPMVMAGETPIYIRDILQELHKNPFLKIKDHDLEVRGIEPNKIRRWFKKHHNMTFQAYQRMLRINTAFHKISKGEAVTNAAFDSGFESLSGFNSSYQHVFGQSASQNKDKHVINIIRLTTPLGPMFGCATNDGVCLLEFTDRKMLEFEFKDITKRLNAVILPGSNGHLKQLERELSEYFNGERKNFTIPLDTPGTKFQNNVWEILQKIPYGETRSYQEQAIRLNKPTAVRAVASANGYNRIAIIIPCHRVIGKNGNLTGYGGGLARKKWLLDFERKNN